MKLRAVWRKGIWAIDDPSNGFSYADNILVQGIPEMIEHFTDLEVALIRMETEEFNGSYKLELFPRKKKKAGTDCKLYLEDKVMQGWLCKVFNSYFPIVPKFVWVKIE